MARRMRTTVMCVEQDDWSCHGPRADFAGGGAGQAKGSAVQYETVAEACRDLERAPAELLPTVCYLCQGLIAPEFAGVDLGLAEKLAVRAVATATGRPMCGSSPGSCWRSSALS